MPTSTWFWTSTVNLTAPPDLAVNPASGLVHTSNRVAFIQSGMPGPGEDPLCMPFLTVDQAMNAQSYPKRHLGDSARAALWELKFRVQSPTKFADPEIVVYKKTGIMANDYVPKYEEHILLPEFK